MQLQRLHPYRSSRLLPVAPAIIPRPRASPRRQTMTFRLEPAVVAPAIRLWRPSSGKSSVVVTIAVTVAIRTHGRGP
ncbi:hypothetical protein NL676_022958 [Syzygium grande]|nr:hypothetical protein NL676_022958 [Syzygium grande]